MTRKAVESEAAGLRRGVLAASLLAVALILASGLGVVGFAWRAIDDSASSQETALVQRYLKASISRTEREAASAAEWDDAYRNTIERNAAWLDRFFAKYYATSFGHDLTLVTDPAGRAFYGVDHGERLSPEARARFSSAVAELVRGAQAEELKRRHTLDRRDREASSQASRGGAVRVGDQVYLLSATSVLPSAYVLTGHEPSYVVVTGHKLDAHFTQELEATLGVSTLHLHPAGFRAHQDSGAVTLDGPDGAPVGKLAWHVSKPGLEAARSMAGPATLVLLALLLSWLLVGLHIRRLLRMLTLRDASLHSTVQALSVARDEALAASVAKSQFIANISHEIRTPLNGVLGMAQAMARDELSKTQRERLTIIQRSGSTLLGLLNDVLDLAKIEAGKLEVEVAPFVLADLLDEVVETYRGIADDKGVLLSREVEPSAIGVYHSDGPRIRQVLQNLIANAVKFTKVGEVRVRALHADGGLTIEVEDTGPGIAADALSRLFGKFEQADASTTRKYGGTGLGLAICAELAGRLGGVLEVESVLGEGSVFRLRLPLAPSEAGPREDAGDRRPEPDAVTEMAPLRVLAAEDNATNGIVLRTLLEQVGIAVVLVENGMRAVEAWRAQPFDLVLMDVQMPVMDGPSATRAIREIEAAEGRARTPIVALTANALVHQQAEYAAAGMDGCLAKPIEVPALLAVLDAVAGAQDDAPEAEPALARA
ncbi:MAG: ATP-binding protein [Pseudomonadota bacterium]